METPFGNLTYCTNIHPGESWEDHFAALKENIPAIKKRLSPDKPFGIGLRLSQVASKALAKKENLTDFRKWLDQEQCGVFVINGFPYGSFHRAKVKDHVHTPDWLTKERVDYTIQLFTILSSLLPKNTEGGVSTSPLSYKYWHSTERQQRAITVRSATQNILKVLAELVRIRTSTGQLLHLDLEPEPDGLIGNGPEFLTWYHDDLLPLGISFLKEHFAYGREEAIAAIKDHIQLCYDICHFAVGYEEHASIIKEIERLGIKVGRVQISAALKAAMSQKVEGRKEVIEAFKPFNESTYLHQVVARQQDGSLKRYPDLPQALEDAGNPGTREWRSHFHVPLFVEDYGALQSTQGDIREVLSIHKEKPFTRYLEVETYTWEVLPSKLKLPMKESIVRELEWVLQALKK
jgi:hypothetical protein